MGFLNAMTFMRCFGDKKEEAKKEEPKKEEPKQEEPQKKEEPNKSVGAYIERQVSQRNPPVRLRGDDLKKTRSNRKSGGVERADHAAHPAVENQEKKDVSV